MTGKQAAASEAVDKILKLDSLTLESSEETQTLEDRQGKILNLDSEEDEEGDKMLKLDSLMLELEETIELDEMIEDRQGKILMLDSEVDCKILMMVKTEEGKILKLKKELDAATEVALAAVSHHIAPTLKPAEPEPAGKKKKVVKTLVLLGLIAYIKAMPSPTSPHFNLPESYYESKEQLYKSGTFKLMNMKLRDYHQAH